MAAHHDSIRSIIADDETPRPVWVTKVLVCQLVDADCRYRPRLNLCGA
jgi:hypothetical protein